MVTHGYTYPNSIFTWPLYKRSARFQHLNGSCLMVAFAQPDEDFAGSNLIRTLRLCLLKFESQSYILLASAVRAIHKKILSNFW